MNQLLEGLRAAAEESRLRPARAVRPWRELTVSELAGNPGPEPSPGYRATSSSCATPGFCSGFARGSWVFFRLADQGSQRRPRTRDRGQGFPPGDPSHAGDRVRLREAKARRAARRRPPTSATTRRDGRRSGPCMCPSPSSRRSLSPPPEEATAIWSTSAPGTGRILENPGAPRRNAGSASTCRGRCWRSPATISSARAFAIAMSAWRTCTGCLSRTRRSDRSDLRASGAPFRRGAPLA